MSDFSRPHSRHKSFRIGVVGKHPNFHVIWNDTRILLRARYGMDANVALREAHCINQSNKCYDDLHGLSVVVLVNMQRADPLLPPGTVFGAVVHDAFLKDSCLIAGGETSSETGRILVCVLHSVRFYCCLGFIFQVIDNHVSWKRALYGDCYGNAHFR